MNLGDGTVRVKMTPKNGIFYKIISEMCDEELNDESDLIVLIKDLHKAKSEYDKVAEAINSVKETGYGLVAPQLSEMKFENQILISKVQNMLLNLRLVLLVYI